MLTKPARPTGPVKKTVPTKRPVKSTGSMTRIVIIVVLVVIAAGVIAYFLLYKKPSAPMNGPTGGQSDGRTEAEVQDGGPGDLQMAVSKAKLQLEWADDKEIVRAVITASTGMDNRDVVYKFDWTLNGQPAGNGSDRLSGFKRGDRIRVKITPFEGEKKGQSRFLDFIVNNTAPKVAESKQGAFDGKTFTYQVKGNDPDGDPLNYALEDAPPGMTIDPRTGAVTWPLKDEDYGEKTFKVKISDGKSGMTTHTVKVDIQKPSADTKSPDEQK